LWAAERGNGRADRADERERGTRGKDGREEAASPAAETIRRTGRRGLDRR
jgi:hypothetical protein